jgi:diphthamide synthase subunit DPH2
MHACCMRRYRLCVARKVRDPFWVVASWAFVLVAFRDGPRNIQGVSSVVDQCRSVSPKSFLGVRSGAMRKVGTGEDCLSTGRLVCCKSRACVTSEDRSLRARQSGKGIEAVVVVVVVVVRQKTFKSTMAFV